MDAKMGNFNPALKKELKDLNRNKNLRERHGNFKTATGSPKQNSHKHKSRVPYNQL